MRSHHSALFLILLTAPCGCAFLLERRPGTVRPSVRRVSNWVVPTLFSFSNHHEPTDPNEGAPWSTPNGNNQELQSQNQLPQYTNDYSLLQNYFERDVSHVLRRLRPWEHDPTVPAWFRTRRLSFTNYWGLEEWELHSSRWRHVRHVVDFPKSRLLRRLLPQLGFLLAWSLAAVRCWNNNHLNCASSGTIGMASAAAAADRIPSLTSLSLVSTFVAALQTLRSNQGLQRLGDARMAMGRMVALTRDTALLWSTYVTPHDPALGWRFARHLCLFGWVLKSHFRETGAEDDLVDALLGGGGSNRKDADAAYCKQQRKRPVAVVMRLRQMVRKAVQADYLGTTVHRLLEDNLKQLNDVVMQGERIRASPVPPVYNSHTSRLMSVYLLLLPWALLGTHLGGRAAVAVTMTVGFAMLGLDEMSHMFEQPFKFMPLYHLAKVSMLDVADAFCKRPPELDDDDSKDNTTTTIPFYRPSYWSVKGRDPKLPYDGSDFPETTI